MSFFSLLKDSGRTDPADDVGRNMLDTTVPTPVGKYKT